ncbi:MAG: hypothetical protein Q8P82_03345 [bacterium]|nr:hypothetical protein [bacterium]
MTTPVPSVAQTNKDLLVRYFARYGWGTAKQISVELATTSFKGDMGERLRHIMTLLAELEAEGLIRKVNTAAEGDLRDYGEFPPYELAR